MLAGLPAELGVAAAAFVGTNVDNALVTVTMVAAAPPERARRIALGQIMGFIVLVVIAAGAAIALFEFSTRLIGLLGLVPLGIGIRGLLALRHAEGRQRTARRAVGSGAVAAALVTIGAGGDNLAVYIPLFRVARFGGSFAIALVFVVGELLLTAFVLFAGRHPRTRGALNHLGVIAAPVLYCGIGVLVLWEAGTLSGLG
jgi:cadmium resistance protein CadD (predicted permease)